MKKQDSHTQTTPYRFRVINESESKSKENQQKSWIHAAREHAWNRKETRQSLTNDTVSIPCRDLKTTIFFNSMFIL